MGTQDGTLTEYQATGTTSFTAKTGSADPFATFNSLGTFVRPVIVDLDADLDLDVVVGSRNGAVHWLRNDGSGSYSAVTGTSNPFNQMYNPTANTCSNSYITSSGDFEGNCVMPGVDGPRDGAFVNPVSERTSLQHRVLLLHTSFLAAPSRDSHK